MKNNFDNLWEKIKQEDDTKKEMFTISESLSTIITKIVIQRNKLNISQRDLAKLTGFKQSAIARLESLKAIPRIDTLVKICYHLDLEIDLATKTETKNKNTTIVFLTTSSQDSVYNIDKSTEYSTPFYISESSNERYSSSCLS
jgi:predicted transcriptional regulator